MLRHHLRTALRALRRDRSYALIGGTSLAVALASCLLVGMFIRAEQSVDRFHPDSDRLRAVWMDSKWSAASEPGLETPIPLAAALEEYTAVEHATVVARSRVQGVRLPGQEGVFDLETETVSESYLDLFGFELVTGNRERVLREPGIVLTEQAAQRLFGDADPMGQPMTLERRRDTVQVSVTGILADASGRSMIGANREALLPLAALPEGEGSWHGTGPRTYVRLASGHTDADLQPAFDSIVEEQYADYDTSPVAGVLPVNQLHLSEMSPAVGFRGDQGFLRLFSAIALFVLLLGVINYINLATARATRRAREVGVRKAVGAGRGQVAFQFLAEAIVLALGAGIAAVLLALVLRPGFNSLFGADLGLGDVDVPFLSAALALALGAGVLAGVYPAAMLSGFRPISALKGTVGEGRVAKGRLRQVLVVVQLVVAVALLSGTGVVLRQIEFAQTADPGYDAGGLVVVDLRKPRLVPQWQAATDAVRALPGVEDVAPTLGYPTAAYVINVDQFDGREVRLRTLEAEPEYLHVLGARPLAGRLYDDRPSDRSDAVVLSELGAREFGWSTPSEAVGQSLSFTGDERTVIGVVADQHMDSFREPIDATQFLIQEPWEDEPLQYSTLLVRLQPGELADGLDGIQETLMALGAETPPEITFLDEKVAGLYESERRLSGVLGAFAGIAILLACLGLFGLAAYAAERRTKEIGVRRVLGASVRQIVTLLSREYAVLVGIGAAIAIPLAVVALQRWLDDFAYRVSLGPGVFIAVVSLLLVVALAVVSGQAVRAARRDPVAALRAD